MLIENLNKYRDYFFLKNQILELSNKIMRRKIHQRDSSANLTKRKRKILVNLKICELRETSLKNIKKKKKKGRGTEQSFRDMWNAIQHINIYTVRAQEKEKHRKRLKEYLKKEWLIFFLI